jgi:hypothetical protein
MSVDEIRDSFLASDSLGDRLRSFRETRVTKVYENKTPVVLPKGGRTIMHVIPYSAGSGLNQVPVPLMESLVEKLQPLIGMGWDPMYNLDGYVTYSTRRVAPGDYENISYVQVFRTGAIESVAGLLVSEREGSPVISGQGTENRLTQGLANLLSAEQALDMVPPLVVGVTFTGVLRTILTENLDPQYDRSPGQPFGDDILQLPEIVVPEYGLDPKAILAPTVEIFWQAFGWPGSVYKKGS